MPLTPDEIRGIFLQSLFYELFYGVLAISQAAQGPTVTILSRNEPRYGPLFLSVHCEP